MYVPQESWDKPTVMGEILMEWQNQEKPLKGIMRKQDKFTIVASNEKETLRRNVVTNGIFLEMCTAFSLRIRLLIFYNLPKVIKL